MNCNCNNECSRCLDFAMAEHSRKILDGTAGRKAIDNEIATKQFHLRIMTDEEFIEKTAYEIAVLRILRERQQTD